MNTEQIKQKKQEYAERYNAAMKAKKDAVANAERECIEYLQSIQDDAKIDFPDATLRVIHQGDGETIEITLTF